VLQCYGAMKVRTPVDVLWLMGLDNRSPRAALQVSKLKVRQASALNRKKYCNHSALEERLNGAYQE
jgi:hypothetical protein